MTMPRAFPSITTRSSISQRGNILTRAEPRSAGTVPDTPRAAVAGRSARGSRTCAEVARRRTSALSSSPPYSRANGTPWATHWSMMLTDTSASRWTLASRRAEVAALDGVVEEAVDAVAVVAVVLGGVDAALGGDGVCTPRRVLEAEAQHLVAEFGERRGGAAPASPVPTTMTVYFGLFAGLMSFWSACTATTSRPAGRRELWDRGHRCSTHKPVSVPAAGPHTPTTISDIASQDCQGDRETRTTRSPAETAVLEAQRLEGALDAVHQVDEKSDLRGQVEDRQPGRCERGHDHRIDILLERVLRVAQFQVRDDFPRSSHLNAIHPAEGEVREVEEREETRPRCRSRSSCGWRRWPGH